MDNIHFDITIDNTEKLMSCLDVAMSVFEKAKGYKLKGDTLLIYWSCNSNDVHPFPRPFSKNDLFHFVKSFIENTTLDNKNKPSIDGSVGKAFRIYNETWGHVDNDPYAFIGVEIKPALYGK